ncbi:acyl carrier protein [Amycolatopsis sp. NPDC026612]|uniref:acyl carrier protein n=1 Tax=Amycolatopsis sp. NPDC026612 TaxID=3155466 RepID=UPI0033E13DC7
MTSQVVADEIYGAVHPAVAEALGLDDAEVTPEATLMDQLGAESIDLLDILFRIERATGIKIEAGDLAEYVQGGIPDEEFGDEHDVITAKGLAQLKKVMPQLDDGALAGKLPATQVMSHFTVANLAAMVAGRAGTGR